MRESSVELATTTNMTDERKKLTDFSNICICDVCISIAGVQYGDLDFQAFLICSKCGVEVSSFVVQVSHLIERDGYF